MWAGTKLGANRSSNADNIQFEVLYANGALEYGGIGGSMGSLGAGDAYWAGGLARDDTDGRLVNNGAGGYFIDKEKDLVFNAQYHSILTDCTDPVHCLALTLAADYAWVTPGDITKNRLDGERSGQRQEDGSDRRALLGRQPERLDQAGVLAGGLGSPVPEGLAGSAV